MHIWTLNTKDGYHYSQDKLQRWKKRADGSMEVESVPQGETLTQQQYKEDCDVNVIMEKFMKTGQMPQTVAPMLEGDFSNLPSYQEALQTVIDANDMFMEIPAKIRLKFENDPQQLINYLADETNNEEAIKLGLKLPKQTPAPDPQLEALKQIQENTKPRKPKPSPED